MFTPQEIQEKTFVKAVFGGYDMQTVDEFLEPLIEDYITLYKENAVLKSKMKVLVEKLEEYRNQEQTLRKTQRTADAMIAEAERKSAEILSAAKAAAPVAPVAPAAPVADAAASKAQAAQVAAAQAQADEVVRQETERMNNAKRTAQNFIDVLEADIRGHLELLEKLKKLDLEEEALPVKRSKPYDFEQDQEKPLVVPKAEPVPVAEAAETPKEIAQEIEQNITRLMDIEEPASNASTRPTSMDSSTIKFTNLQFGRNYDPTSK